MRSFSLSLLAFSAAPPPLRLIATSRNHASTRSRFTAPRLARASLRRVSLARLAMGRVAAVKKKTKRFTGCVRARPRTVLDARCARVECAAAATTRRLTTTTTRRDAQGR